MAYGRWSPSTLCHQPSAISHDERQNLYATLSTTVRGGRIAVGERNCVNVFRCPVVGSRKLADGVSVRTCHTQFAFVRLSRSSVASNERRLAKLNNLPMRTSIR